MNRESPDNDKFMSDECKDFFGKDINVGDRLAKPSQLYGTSSPVFVICRVTEVEAGKIYLDNSKIPIRFPRRCIKISSRKVTL